MWSKEVHASFLLQPFQICVSDQLWEMKVEQVNLSKGSELRSPSPKHCGHFSKSAQLADSPRLHCGKANKYLGFS